MEFITTYFIPILFSVIFGGMALLGLSLNLYARQKHKLQLMIEAFKKGDELKSVQIPLFPFILKLSSLAHVFYGPPDYEDEPELYAHPDIQKQMILIGNFNKFYFFALPLAFLVLIGMVVLAGLAG